MRSECVGIINLDNKNDLTTDIEKLKKFYERNNKND